MSLQTPPPSPAAMPAPNGTAGLDDGIKPWTIRGVPPEARNAAIAAARRDNLNLGEWLDRAIRSAIQRDREADRAPVVVGQPAPAASDKSSELSDVERIAASLRDLAGAGFPISKTIAGKITKALVAQLPSPSRTGRKNSADATPEVVQPPDHG